MQYKMTELIHIGDIDPQREAQFRLAQRRLRLLREQIDGDFRRRNQSLANWFARAAARDASGKTILEVRLEEKTDEESKLLILMLETLARPETGRRVLLRWNGPDPSPGLAAYARALAAVAQVNCEMACA